LKVFFLKVMLGFLFLVFSIPPSVYGEDGRIADLSVTFSQGNILVSARLERGVHLNFEEDIHNGIQKDLFYYVLLKRRQTLWMDEEVLSRTIKHTIKYDILKKQYRVITRIEQTPQEQKVEHYEELRRLISEIKNVKITPISFLDPNETYYISVKAEMRATTLPFYLEYLLFFIPFLDLDTPWADSSPFYSQ